MSMTDPIAEMLTRIRNGLLAHHQVVEIPSSRIKTEIASILKNEGYVDAVEVVEENPQNLLRLTLKYDHDGSAVITGLRRISKPGRRVYCQRSSIPKVLGGLGISIISTSRGVLSGTESRKQGVGGEVLCHIW